MQWSLFYVELTTRSLSLLKSNLLRRSLWKQVKQKFEIFKFINVAHNITPISVPIWSSIENYTTAQMFATIRNKHQEAAGSDKKEKKDAQWLCPICLWKNLP